MKFFPFFGFISLQRLSEFPIRIFDFIFSSVHFLFHFLPLCWTFYFFRCPKKEIKIVTSNYESFVFWYCKRVWECESVGVCVCWFFHSIFCSVQEKPSELLPLKISPPLVCLYGMCSLCYASWPHRILWLERKLATEVNININHKAWIDFRCPKNGTRAIVMVK